MKKKFKMGRKSELLESERAQIDILRRANPNWSGRRIAVEVGRSRCAVARYLQNPAGYSKKKRSGRPQKTTDRERRAIINSARARQSAPKVLAELNLDCSARTVLRVIQNDPNMVFRRHRSKPPLTNQHLLERLKFAWSKVSWTLQDWSPVIFSDEKKWNLDGPDFYVQNAYFILLYKDAKYAFSI